MTIPYYSTRGGDKPGTRCMGYWAPCLARRSKKSGKIEPTLMAKLGFKLVDCGEDGPLAWAIAESWNRKWEAARQAHLKGSAAAGAISREPVYPPNSLGECFVRFKQTATWAQKKPRTQEDWERGWKLIEPMFGVVDPRTVSLEHVDFWYGGDPKDARNEGLLQKVGVREAHRGMKIWRALWTVGESTQRADGERYCLGKDPSLGIRRKTPTPRNAFYREGEAVRLVKRAWRMGYKGLACIYAVAWDTTFSPVDARGVTPDQWRGDAQGAMVALDRAKTGKAAIGTLSARTVRLVEAYVAELKAAGIELFDTAPMFRTPGAEPGPQGGRRWRPRPYTKDLLSKHHRVVRAIELPGDKRNVMDFRRSGAIEATAGDVTPAALAGKMANSIDQSRALQQTYLPHNAAVVRLADAARVRGRAKMRGEGGGKT